MGRRTRFSSLTIIVTLGFVAGGCTNQTVTEPPVVEPAPTPTVEPTEEPPEGSTPPVYPAQAVWVDKGTVIWPGADPTMPIQICSSLTGGILVDPTTALPVTGAAINLDGLNCIGLEPTELNEAEQARFPWLAHDAAFAVSVADQTQIADMLKGQLIPQQGDKFGTGVQIAGVLDEEYPAAADAHLGPVYNPDGSVTISVWAPTQQNVNLEIFPCPAPGFTGLPPAQTAIVPMAFDAHTGVWSATGNYDGDCYLFGLDGWIPTQVHGGDWSDYPPGSNENWTQSFNFEPGHFVTGNQVTDPYSVALTQNSRFSIVANLDDPQWKPPGWDTLVKPAAVPLRDAQIQELHVRDFSTEDNTVPADHVGKYLAFADTNTAGSQHLQALQQSGVNFVHLLPVFDFATVEENPALQQGVDVTQLAGYGPAVENQQAAIQAIQNQDAYNWGYDPLHYNVPEGSYAIDNNTPERTKEFREMVEALNNEGLRVVMDVVYNHTSAAGQADNSVLDKIVPGYYQRYNATGDVANSTCCSNTAPENMMMGKLVVDSVLLWAKEYKIDGFRFDLMAFHPKANIVAVREALDNLTLEHDGVDGKNIIMYGEGWDFGEVGGNARFEQASQPNMAGTNVATYSDRARDAVRGGSPFDDARTQGFGSGLYTNSTEWQNGAQPNNEQLNRLLHYQDQIKVGLTGNLAGYSFVPNLVHQPDGSNTPNTTGQAVNGSQVDYNGSPAGYSLVPGDSLAYVDNHDNTTLFDKLTYALPSNMTPEQRARMQNVAMATAQLSQGPAILVSGSDLMRSKSLDEDSYNSGDWFNAIQWNCQNDVNGNVNGFGRGLPIAEKNQDRWPFAAPLLDEIQIPCDAIQHSTNAYQDIMRIRASEPAFSLATLGEVQDQLEFPLSGPDEQPGVIVEKLANLVIIFNATPETVTETVPGLTGSYALHPDQANGSDPIVKTSTYANGTFTVPALTVAVFQQQ